MTERDTGGNGAASIDGRVGSLRDRQAAYLPDGYELVSTGDLKHMRLLRPNGSEVRSFEKGEIKEAERAAFKDAHERRHDDPP